MKENDDSRLAKAAMNSLRVPAPGSLTADLKRLARNRKPNPSLWDGLRDALSNGAWAYGAGAAFTAAAVGIVLLRAVPRREAAPSPAAAERAAPQSLQDLWTDDDGEDNDEI